MIEIIPATDIIGGQCVRLTQGDYASRKTYYRDPLEAALRFEEAGIRRLHMVDLDGAKASEPRNLAVVALIHGDGGDDMLAGNRIGAFGHADQLVGRYASGDVRLRRCGERGQFDHMGQHQTPGGRDQSVRGRVSGGWE